LDGGGNLGATVPRFLGQLPAGRPRTVPLALIALTFAAFSPGLGNQFVNWDDGHNLLENDHFRGLGWNEVTWAWTTFHLGVYQPLGWLLFATEYRAWGLDPRGYHAVSLAWHAANVVALYALTLHLLRRCPPALPRARGLECWAGLAVALYAVHPLRVEAVSWASCQPYLPCAFFALLSVTAYLRGNGEGTRPHTGWLIGSFLCYVVSVLFKAPAVSLPGVLLLLDIYPLRRLGGNGGWIGPSVEGVWREKAWFSSVALIVAAVASLAKASALGGVAAARPGLASRVAAACYGAWFYLGKTVVPRDVAAFYVTPAPVVWSQPHFLEALVAAAGLTAALVLLWSHWPGPLATWAAFLVLLAPVSGFVSLGTQFVTDRYTYLAAMAFVPLVAASLNWLASSPSRARRSIVLASAGLGLAAVLTGQTRALCRTWHDSQSLWGHALAHGARRSMTVHNNLAAEYYNQGRIEEAIATWRAALMDQADPIDLSGRVLILSNLGKCLEERGTADEAIAQFAEVARLLPRSAGAAYQWGRALAAHERYDDAIPHFADAIALDPNHARARASLDDCLRRQRASRTAPASRPPQ
jgi:hypothetical protein